MNKIVNDNLVNSSITPTFSRKKNLPKVLEEKTNQVAKTTFDKIKALKISGLTLGVVAVIASVPLSMPALGIAGFAVGAVSAVSLIKSQKNTPPPIPKSYTAKASGFKYVIKAPKPNQNFVLLGNRDDFSVRWYKIGESVEDHANSLGKTTMRSLKENGISQFSKSDHNFNLTDLSLLSNKELKEKAEAYGVSTKGSREKIFKKLVDAKEKSIG